MTREEGGSIGWVNLGEDFDDDDEATHNDEGSIQQKKKNPNEHLNLILPPSARQHVLNTPTKPGDILSVESSRGVHLIQVVDVMVDVRKLSNSSFVSIGYEVEEYHVEVFSVEY